MKIIFLLPQGMVEWPVPENQKADFSFMAMAHNIRAAGFFLQDGFYIRHELMVGMLFHPEEGAPSPAVRKDLQ
jgi:hypothetical protein